MVKFLQKIANKLDLLAKTICKHKNKFKVNYDGYVT